MREHVVAAVGGVVLGPSPGYRLSSSFPIPNTQQPTVAQLTLQIQEMQAQMDSLQEEIGVLKQQLARKAPLDIDRQRYVREWVDSINPDKANNRQLCSLEYQYQPKSPALEAHETNRLNPYACLCGVKFQRIGECLHHVLALKAKPPFRCPSCRHQFPSGIQLRQHYSQEHEDHPIELWKKSRGGRGAPRPPPRSISVTQVRSPAPPPRKEYFTSRGGGEAEPGKSQSHPFRCTLKTCDKQFGSKEHFKQHMRVHRDFFFRQREEFPCHPIMPTSHRISSSPSNKDLNNNKHVSSRDPSRGTNWSSSKPGARA